MPLVRCPIHNIPYNSDNPRGCPACAREREGATSTVAQELARVSRATRGVAPPVEPAPPPPEPPPPVNIPATPYVEGQPLSPRAARRSTAPRRTGPQAPPTGEDFAPVTRQPMPPTSEVTV